MPVLQSLSPVLFYGDTIFVVDHQGEPFAPMKPIIENLGLKWAAQTVKLSKNKSRWGVSIIETPSASGLQKTLCIPVRKLAWFLATINPSRVREELRPKIIQYQNECDDALWNYWTTGAAKRPEANSCQPSQPDLPLYDQNQHLITESERDLLNTIQELDTNNQRLANSLEETRVSYIKLLESHVSMLEIHLGTQTKASSPWPPLVRTPKRKIWRSRVSPDEAANICKMFKEGFSKSQICRELNRTRTTIDRHVRGVEA